MSVPGEVLEKQVELSAKAKAVFEESLRQYNEEVVVTGSTTSGVGHPPPLPPKTDRPPLPPKQRSRRSTEHESSDDQTYVNSAELQRQQQQQQQQRSNRTTRLSINSPAFKSSTPVHPNQGGGSLLGHGRTGGGGTPVQHGVHNPSTPVHIQQIHNHGDRTEFVYGSYYGGGGESGGSGGRAGATRVSVTNGEAEYTPPLLPPKEALVSARLTPERTSTVGGDKKRAGGGGVTSTKIVSTGVGGNKPLMKSIETQTDESDFVIMYPDEHIQEDESFNQTDSEYSPESNRSLSPDYPEYPHHHLPDYSPYPAYHHRPSPQDSSSGGGNGGLHAEFYNTLFERPVSAQSVGGLRHAGRRKLEPVQSVPVPEAGGGTSRHPDPIIAGEINWSVSQLRTLFNQAQQGGGAGGNLSSPAGGSSSQYDSAAASPSDLHHHHFRANSVRQSNTGSGGGGGIIDNGNRHLIEAAGRGQTVVMEARPAVVDRRLDYHYYGQQTDGQDSDQESYV